MQTQRLIHLKSKHHSLLITAEESAEIIHWGKQLKTVDDDVFLATQRPIAQARLDIDVPLSLCPESGRGYFNAPGIEGTRAGLDWAPVFHLTDIQATDNTACLTLQDAIAQLQLIIELQLDYDSDILQKRLTVRNLGDSVYDLQRLSATLPINHQATELLTYHGRWCHEFHTQRRPFLHGGFIQENRRGRTSHENFPALLAGTPSFSQQRGDVWGFHLAWSGNHQLRADIRSDGRRFIQAGELLLPGEIRLGHHESYTTPWLYGVFSEQGINGVSKSFHRYIRQNILSFPTNKPRPVHLNTWEGIYFDHQPDYLIKMATEAAAIGVERFIIDDGWFVGRNDDKAALGDWYLDEKKYPNGLTPIIDHVIAQGMEFGLWVEPEMVSKQSMLYRNHPDWLLAISGYDQPSGRWQYVLDLQNPHCFAYLFERLDDLLSRYRIHYLKWDMNRELVQAAHLGHAATHGQTQALYRLIDQLLQAHPAVEIESCASGGGRIDMEILKRTHRFWTSDCNDALERQHIQRGMSYFFPPEVMGAHIGPAKSHSTRRQHHPNLRGVTALFGHLGVELDPVKATTEEKQAFAHYIGLHKQFRQLIHTGQSFRLDCADNQQYQYGVANDDEILLVICQLAMPDYALPAPVCLPYVKQQARYAVRLIEMPNSSSQLMKQPQQWLNKTLTLSGAHLANVGVIPPILDPESALIIHFKRIIS